MLLLVVVSIIQTWLEQRSFGVVVTHFLLVVALTLTVVIVIAVLMIPIDEKIIGLTIVYRWSRRFGNAVGIHEKGIGLTIVYRWCRRFMIMLVVVVVGIVRWKIVVVILLFVVLCGLKVSKIILLLLWRLQ
jgi:hypothetical protein